MSSSGSVSGLFLLLYPANSEDNNYRVDCSSFPPGANEFGIKNFDPPRLWQVNSWVIKRLELEVVSARRPRKSAPVSGEFSRSNLSRCLRSNYARVGGGRR